MNESNFSDLPIGAKFRLKNAPTAADRLVEWKKNVPNFFDAAQRNAASSGDELAKIAHNAKCLLPPYGEDPNRGRERRKQADRRARLDEAAYKFDFPTIDNLARALLDGEYEVVKVIVGSES